MDISIILILFLLFTSLLYLVHIYYNCDNNNASLSNTKKKNKNVSFADEENKPLETIIKIT
tara:strand:+ start:219 stop:401 length:183 start_codon:yes stop_codon:yes gene_type:complete